MNILDEIKVELAALRNEVVAVRQLLKAAAPVPHRRMGIREAARMIGLSVDTVRRGCRTSNRWPHHRDGNRLYFFQDELQAHLDKKPETATSLAEEAVKNRRA